MPLSDSLAVVNLALDHLGEPYLTDLAADTTPAGQAARLHYPQALETILEGHHWSFATRTTSPTSILLGPAVLPPQMDPLFVYGDDLAADAKGGLLTASPADDGADLSKIFTDDGSDLAVDLSNAPVTSGATWTRVAYYTPTTGQYYFYYLEGGFAVGFSSDAGYPADSTIGDVTEWTPLFGSEPGTPIFTFQNLYAPDFGSAFLLPADCLRVLSVNGWNPYAGSADFEIQGRHLLFRHSDETAPVIRYITNEPPVGEWPTTFTDAVAFLLASRLALKLTQDQRLADTLFQKHETALGKARSKDSRETRSAENHGPRQLAARSHLVAARFGRYGIATRIWADPPPNA